MEFWFNLIQFISVSGLERKFPHIASSRSGVFEMENPINLLSLDGEIWIIFWIIIDWRLNDISVGKLRKVQCLL